MSEVINIYKYIRLIENIPVAFYSLLPTYILYRDYPKYIVDNNMSLSSFIKIRECLNFNYFDNDYSHVVRRVEDITKSYPV